MAEAELPAGLYRCERCGEVRGVTAVAAGDRPPGERSTCLCEGLICKRCGLRKRRRPMSNAYHPGIGGFLHVAHYVGFIPYCPDCWKVVGPD